VGNWGFGNEFELFAGHDQRLVSIQAPDVTLVQQDFYMTALPERRHRRRPGDDLQRVRAGARGQEPGDRAAVPAERLQRHQLAADGTGMLQDAIWANTTS
jgi:NitT/TauT family transport system substrate-binding protein